jgi:hypothetical protein
VESSCDQEGSRIVLSPSIMMEICIIWLQDFFMSMEERLMKKTAINFQAMLKVSSFSTHVLAVLVALEIVYIIIDETQT